MELSTVGEMTKKQVKLLYTIHLYGQIEIKLQKTLLLSKSFNEFSIGRYMLF